MSPFTRYASSILFAGGLVLVFTGLTAAFGFSLVGILASIAVVAALLYAGGVWFGGSTDTTAPTVLVFDRHLRIAVGPHAGESVVSRFPLPIRAELERRCVAAIGGHSSRFVCSDGTRDRTFDVAAVLTAQQSPISGLLVEGATVTTEPAVVDSAALGVV
jgi:hypothetical protein